MEKNLLEQAVMAIGRGDYVEAARLASTASAYLSRRAIAGQHDEKRRKQTQQKAESKLDIKEVKNIAGGTPYFRA